MRGQVRKNLIKRCGWLAFVLLVALGSAGVYLAEGTLRMPRRPMGAADEAAAQDVAQSENATVKTVCIDARDGARLSGWYFAAAAEGNGRVVIVLHGQGDNRGGSLGFDRLFLHHRYSVLAPDSRAHGSSGGDVATYGPLEAADLSRWIDWLQTTVHPSCTYGLGESMGAAILLQSLETEKRFCAVAAESSFSSFREIGFYRLSLPFGGREWLGRTVLRPVIESGLLYGRLRYGVDLGTANPARAVARTGTRILLIHGTADESIPLSQSERILAAAGGKAVLWKVEGAGHTGALAAAPAEFEKRVIAFFADGDER